MEFVYMTEPDRNIESWIKNNCVAVDKAEVMKFM